MDLYKADVRVQVVVLNMAKGQPAHVYVIHQISEGLVASDKRKEYNT